MNKRELLLINKRRLLGLFAAIFAAMSLVGCNNGGESASVLSSTESSSEIGEQSSSQLSFLSSVQSSSETVSTESTEVSQVLEPIEEPNVFRLVRDPLNEVNIRLDGDKVTVYGKDTDMGIQWISLDNGESGAPQRNAEGFSVTLGVSAGCDGYTDLRITDRGGHIDSYRLKYSAADKQLSYVFPDEIVQKNIKVAETPTNLAPALVKRYVTTKENGDVNVILDKVREISDEICEGLDSDYDKLRAISRWVSDNIYYDNPAHDAGIPEECLSLEYMLDKHSSVCGGYSNMTSALCAAQGIKCYNIKGKAVLGDVTYAEKPDIGGYHEWNYAVIDGRVIWIDSGWNSYNYFRSSGAYECHGIGYKYFDIGIETFSQNHICNTAEYRDYYNLPEE